MKKETTFVLKLIVALAFISGCTKTRQAELADDAKENVYAISEFGTPDNATFSANKISVDSAATANSVKALDQSATLSSDDVTVPARLKYMFDKLPMSGLTAKQFSISFSVDKDYVTSYKKVNNARELTMLERGIAITAKEAQLLTKASKSTSSEYQTVATQQKDAVSERYQILSGKKEGSLLVPMFKYKVEAYGILERTKNELKEDTSVLVLKKTDFKNASHIQITSTADSRLLVGMSADQMKEVNQLFDEKKIDNMVTTAGDLQTKLNVGLGFLDSDSKVFTRLDANLMHVYQITKASALNDDQKRMLKTNSGNQQVLSCQDSAVAQFIKSSDTDCVLLLKADLAVSFVTSKLTLVDTQGNTSNAIQFDQVPRSQSVGLVKIVENTAAVPKDISGTLDPKNALKVSDIVNKEFFFRRTFQDAPSTSLLMPGMAGDLILARFVLEDNRIVVRASEKFINYKNEDSNQFEVLMSIGATYMKVNKKDASGSLLTIPTIDKATKEDAEYVVLDWTNNSLPIVQSPLSMTTYGQCLGPIGNTNISDVVYKNDGELVLNFTYNYTTVLRPECATYYDTQNYNGGDTASQQVHLIRERISFRENKIKKEDEKVVSSQVPFPAQNKMGYGLFTKGIITPTANGNRSQSDGQLDLPIVHDFTNGKTLTYTIGGLADNDPQRQMIIDLTLEVIADWNKSLHLAFKGNPALDRTGDYIIGVVNGEGSDKGFLGDTDKNFLWYDDKINEGMSVIGVSQAGSHPRTGTIIADQVVMYLGNSRNYIEGTVRAAQIAKDYSDMLKKVEAEKMAAAIAQDATVVDPTVQPGAAGTDSKQALMKNITAQKNYISQMIKSPSANSVLAVSPKVLAQNIKISDQTLAQLRQGTSLSDTKGNLAKLSLTAKQMPYIKELFAKLADAGTSFSSSDIDAVLAREILKSNGQLMSTQQKSLLKLHVQLAEAKSNLQKIFMNRPGCVTFRDAADYTSKFTGMTFEQALRISLKATLAHEMGHSMGLTHNFIASSDKPNWEFTSENTGRNYSSIMDYQDEARQVYQGPGPYDVHALRAGYSGLIEVSNMGAQSLKTSSPKSIQVIDGKNYISVETVKAIAANNSWSNLNRAGALSLVKDYKYCTDKDLNWEPNCRQFDLGGSMEENVKNAIADYNERYGVSRFGYDRREFGWVAKSRVIGRSFDVMLQIRQYLDEVYYRLNVERSSLTADQANDYEMAALRGWEFFQQVLGTPDAPAVPFLSPDRFFVANYAYKDKDKKVIKDKVFVETKALRDLWASEDRLETIGMEEDKIIAMQLLTMRSIGYQKYAMHSIAGSYLEFEKYLLGISEPLQMPTVLLLNGLSMNKLTAFVTSDKANYIPLQTKNEVTEAMRFYSAISSIISLEGQALTEKDNFANLFKVGSTLGSTLKDRISLSRLDNPAKSKAATYFWAPDNSASTQAVLSDLSQGRVYLNAAADLEKPMLAIASAVLANPMEVYKAGADAFAAAQAAGLSGADVQKAAVDAVTAKTAELNKGRTPEQLVADRKQQIATAEASLLAVLQTLNKNGSIASAEAIAADPRLALANQVATVSAFIQNNSSYIFQTVRDETLKSVLAGMKPQNTDLGESLPIVAIAQKAIADTANANDKFSSFADMLVDSQVLENKDNIVMKNMEILNSITVMVNPGFNR